MSNTNETHNQHTNLHTIKDVMNKLDCSRSTIYNTMTKHDLTFIKKDNVNHIDDEQLTIISNTIMLNKHKQPKQYQTHQDDNVKQHDKQDVKHDDTHNTSDTSDNNDMYNKVLNELIKQLNAKDNQIDKLQQQLSDTTQALHNQQRLDYDRLHDSGSSENIQATYTDNTQATHRAHTSTHEPTNNRSDISDNSPASHTHSDVHTDDISDDNKDEDVTSIDNKESSNTSSNEHTKDNKNPNNVGSNNKRGLLSRLFNR